MVSAETLTIVPPFVGMGWGVGSFDSGDGDELLFVLPTSFCWFSSVMGLDAADSLYPPRGFHEFP